MTTTISQAHNEARLAGTKTFLDTGAGTATVQVYTAPRPASGATPTGATLLVAIALTKPCGSVAAGVLTITSTDVPMCVATGDAAWARILNANGDFAMDCDVSITGGAGEIQLDNIHLLLGGREQLVSAVLG